MGIVDKLDVEELMRNPTEPIHLAIKQYIDELKARHKAALDDLEERAYKIQVQAEEIGYIIEGAKRG